MSNIEFMKVEFLALIKANKNSYQISLKKISEWLEMPEMYENYLLIEDSRENFINCYLRNEKFPLDESENENDFTNHFIMRNQEEIDFPWFSTEGFKMFCVIFGGEKAQNIRRSFIQIKYDYLSELKQNELRLKKYNKEFENIISGIFKKIPIYIVNLDFVNKIQIDFNGDDEDGYNFENIDYEKEFNMYHHDDVYNQDADNNNNNNPVMYYCLGEFNGNQKTVTNHHKIGEIYIKDKEHLDMIIDHFGGDAVYKTQQPLVWKTTYKEILNVRTKILKNRISFFFKQEFDRILINC
jgi:hypothetical protein